MAWRAGCRAANLDFCQFPSYLSASPKNQAIPAIRGECGIFVYPDGRSFMDTYHARAELVPRDIVTRAIDNETKKFGFDCVYLDISHKPASFTTHQFPTV